MRAKAAPINITGFEFPSDQTRLLPKNGLNSPILSAVSAIAIPMLGSFSTDCAITKLPCKKEANPLNIYHLFHEDLLAADFDTDLSLDLIAPFGSGNAPYTGVVNPLPVEASGKLVAEFLTKAGVAPDRRGVTSDGSHLLEYFHGRNACVDVYPNGDVIFILKNGHEDHVYEFDMTELSQIVNLLKDGGLAG